MSKTSPPTDTAVQLVWLFDVDGTLLLTEGASREAFSRALHERLGIEDDLANIRFDGRTEPLILADILAAHGARMGATEEAAFWNAVFLHMRALLVPPRGHMLPGIPELLEGIDREPTWALGLLTGNMTGMAGIKLDRFGLRQRFVFGAFGEEAADRNGLARIAVARAAERYGVPSERCIVVGDTENDITCARAAGARVVAVATGRIKLSDLAARSPDLLLESFADPTPLLNWARRIARGA